MSCNSCCCLKLKDAAITIGIWSTVGFCIKKFYRLAQKKTRYLTIWNYIFINSENGFPHQLIIHYSFRHHFLFPGNLLRFMRWSKLPSSDGNSVCSRSANTLSWHSPICNATIIVPALALQARVPPQSLRVFTSWNFEKNHEVFRFYTLQLIIVL